MNNPIQIFQDLFNVYLKYINSGLPFFRDEYNQERNRLLRESGSICQPPIIELVPKYHEKASLKDFCLTEGVSTDINDFVNTGLFVNNSHTERRLYDHQYSALKEAFINRKNIIVTTGTGSGKTECFLLPVISDLVTESKKWGVRRKRAMRTLILYPLNALAEDQMIRLRKALNSHKEDKSGSLDWLDENRGGHRFYFGRYTGSTPVSGTREKSMGKLREEKKNLTADWLAAKEAALENGNSELLYHVPCMEDDSAEMWDRFSMQDNAPDILITNYSMLNVMLMRNTEASIFEDTKKWLEEDPRHVFHLVIDELHTYRGTAGTEVAYLIRVLLDRLGLTPNSPQVQFLASSASMEETKQTQDYLCEFFGLTTSEFENSFKLLSNPKQECAQKPAIDLPVRELTVYYNSDASEDKKQSSLLKSLGVDNFYELTEKYRLVDWLKYSLSASNGIIAKDIYKIADRLGLCDDDRIPVVSSLIKILCQSEKGGNYVAPIRAHFFFRSVSGLWGCSDPNCNHIGHNEQFEGRTVGKLYKRPRSICDCGKKILEILVCENCGELYFGGYKIVKEGKTYLSVEKPITEKFCNYCVLWYEDKAEVKDGWKRVNFNSITGEYQENPDGEYSLYEQKSENDTFFPEKCPQCEISYKVNDKNSLTPIRRHVTGLQKVNQILADALIRTMKNAKESNTKVVLFSDSRQAAAKLSAGIELDHYHDVLRWSILTALKGESSDVAFLKAMRHKDRSDLTKDEQLKFRQLSSQPIYHEITQNIRDLWDNWLSEEDVKKLDAYFESVEGMKLDHIEDKVFNTMLKLGMNPAGPKPTVTYNINGGYWYDLFDFDGLKLKNDLSDSKRGFADLIRHSNKIEQLASIFANKNKSFEDLRLGYLAPSAKMEDEVILELTCSIIRILGSKRRIMGIPTRFPRTDSFPKQAKDLIKEVFDIRSKKEVDDKVNLIKAFLRKNNIIDKQYVALTGEGISFIKSDIGSKYWICPTCKTIHMQASNGKCINCLKKLDKEYILEEEDITNPNDYYLTLLNSTENVYRLHCEELTGQTSKVDSRKRQRLFQDIFLKTENPQVDGIDLLSVTTTMEAGVDIGSLSAVMMGNVPPQRFNYQQRVGRAGRRGNPLSIAMTVARGTSHDLTHFFETERMVSDTPKDPYLEVRTREIAERIVYKEILYASLGENSNGHNDSVHGNFGYVNEWITKKTEVKDWIEKNETKITHIIDIVTRGTDISKQQKEDIKSFVNDGLVDRITEIVESPEYTQEILSERLANAGMLPMFGFPTRTRNLYLSEPNKLPWDDVVSRDIEMALNSFAPGHEIVKDKKVYRAVGVVDYEYNKSHAVVPRFNSLNVYKQPLKRCKVCGYSTISQIDESSVCPVCGNDMNTAKICSPLGFCVDYLKPIEDFNGSYDWYSPNSDIKLDCEKDLSYCPSVKNLTIRNNLVPSQGLVHLVNDNNGDFYRLGKNYSGIYISRDAYSEEEAKTLQLSFESKYAFVASKTTGVLTLSITEENPNVCLNPIIEKNSNSHAVRAAFLSWGYLVRKAVSSYLDIDSSELNVGYYISPKTHKAEVFFVERLENGAGYCNFLCGRRYQDIPLKAIVEPLIEGGNIYSQLCGTNHLSECTSSCYDCIRDYSNQSVHNILDWRLGLDIARLADDPKAEISFNIHYWKDYLDKTIVNILILQGYEIEKECDLYIAKFQNKKFCLIHPLWSEHFINRLIGGIGGITGTISVFDISKLK